MMQKRKTVWQGFFLLILMVRSVFADADDTACCCLPERQGWCLNLGGQYTWMSLTTPPTYTGSTGGVHGDLTYQEANTFFGQVRSVYNGGKLHSSLNDSRDYEWYGEFIGGWCFAINPNWTVTPYIGMGLDYLKDKQEAYASVSAIQLKYQTYYAIVGVGTEYSWDMWYLGAKVSCLPVFDQYLRINGLSGAGWTMRDRVGADVRLPIGYRLKENIWIELAPYYRMLPIGKSSVLGLPQRNLNQWGAFLTFSFYL